MATLKQLLQHLVTERDNLKANLIEKGITINDEDKFNELVPLVKQIQQNIGNDTSDATATSSDILNTKTAYAGGQKITGTIETFTPAESYFPTSGSDNTIQTSGKYVDGDIVIKNDSNFIASNIKKDVTIYGVTGTLDTSGIDTTDATATADDIIINKTAYVNGEKVTGNLEIYDLSIDNSTNLVYNNNNDLEILPEVNNKRLLTKDKKVEKNIFIKGDSNLIPQNIVQGVTIFNVTGTAVLENNEEDHTNATTYTLMTGREITTNGITINGGLDLSLLPSLTGGI